MASTTASADPSVPKNVSANSEGDAGALPLGVSPSSKLALAGVLLLAALLYLPSLGYGFIYDDGWTILSNGFLRDPELSLLFDPQARLLHIPDAFRPTSVLFEIGAYQLFGLTAPLHHATNIALHLGVCAALYALLSRLNAPPPLRLGSTALFGVMAVHAEVVSVVSYREDLLATGLALLALLAAFAIDTTKTRSLATFYALTTVLLSALACSAKASAAPLPLFFLLLGSLSPWRAPLRWTSLSRGFALLALGVLLSFLQDWSIQGGEEVWTPYQPGENLRLFASRVGPSMVWAASTQIHLRYLQQLLLPYGLSPEYVDFGAHWTDPATLLSSFALLSLFGYGLACAWKRHRPLVALTILGAFALALPTSNLIGMPNMQADRFLYFSSAPVCVGLTAFAFFAGQKLHDRLRDPLWAGVPFAVLLFIQGSIAWAAQTPYASNNTLWQAASKRAPSSARAQAMRGLHRLAQSRGRPTLDPQLAALVHADCRNASRLDPQYELPEICHARLASARRDWKASYTHFERALSFSPDRNDRIFAALAQLRSDLPHISGPSPQQWLEQASKPTLTPPSCTP